MKDTLISLNSEQPPSFLDLASHKKKRQKRSFADVKVSGEKIPDGFEQATWFGDSDVPPAGDVETLMPESAKEKEATVENCRLVGDPQFTQQIVRRKTTSTWTATVALIPDLWHTEEGELMLHAQGNAEKANKLGLKDGDVIDVTGVRWTQEVALLLPPVRCKS